MRAANPRTKSSDATRLTLCYPTIVCLLEKRVDERNDNQTLRQDQQSDDQNRRENHRHKPMLFSNAKEMPDLGQHRQFALLRFSCSSQRLDEMHRLVSACGVR